MRQRFSILLMVASLVLLAGFLFFFLKKTRQDKLDTLRQQTSFLFVNSVRGVESKLFNQFIFNGLHENSDSLRDLLMRLPAPRPNDSLKVITFIGTHERTEIRDSNVQVTMHTQIGQAPPNTDISGSLSIVVAMSSDGDSAQAAAQHLDVRPVLLKNFQAAMSASGLPVKYRVTEVSSDSTALQPIAPALESGSYTDLASGQRFSAQITDYERYIWRQMLPELLFSGLLFGCVALAFFTVWRNLKQQQRLTELKNDFIRNVTHELKTPIATVSVAVEALQNFDALADPSRTREYLDISKNELGRLSLLVDKVLRMSLFEKTEPELKLETFDFKNLLAEVLRSMKLQFDRARATVSFDAVGQDFTMEGDRLHLASVVYNLLDNALKYSPLQPTISVELAQSGSQISLQVSDNGVGIPAEYRDKVFEKFFRVPTGDRHDVKGHGLGLSYVASVVEKHRGDISVEEHLPSGTRFSIRLPRRA